MQFINDNFLLRTQTAKHLYRAYAAHQPILDYHCHLSPKDIAENRRFENLFEIWLEGDHYKWRAMRANAVPEKYCTGNASAYEKFLAWARTVPYTLRNPLYHWTHLELRRYFDIDELLDETTAPQIWKRANDLLQHGDLTTHGILRKFGVTALCTTDDPTDSLEYHERIQSSGLVTRVYPAFRPDAALRTDDPETFNAWVDRLGGRADIDIGNFSHFLEALESRHDHFHEKGCRLSDHGLASCPVDPCSRREAAAIFQDVRRGDELTADDTNKFASFLMLFLGELDAKRGWTKQLHLGACRNNNTRMLRTLGKDTGFDCIGDWPQIAALTTYLDRLEQANALPRVILYNVNPAENYAFASVINSFQGGDTPGKVQFGTSWWFLDQKEGIEWQINALSNCGLLSRFVGMVTDSRSFMSYPRHEYFRRVLCNLIGNDVETGDLPDEEKLLGSMIENICHGNAASYFHLPGIGNGASAATPLGEDMARAERG
jgi:glucuronate isomerase